MATITPLACRCLFRLRRLTFRGGFDISNLATHRRQTSTEAAHVQNKLQEILHASETELFNSIKKDKITAEERLAGLGAEDEKRLKVLKLEHQVFIHMGQSGVPDAVKDEWWLRLLSCPTVQSRKKLYRYYNDIERKETAKQIKKQKRELSDVEREVPWDSTSKSTIFLFVRNRTMDHFYNSRLVHSLANGPYLVIDVGFEDHMNLQENTGLFTQLLYAYGITRKIDREPFYMMLCNAKKGGHLLRRIASSSETSSDRNHLFTVTEKSYLDIFPKEKLVYLSPHAPNELTDYNADDIYIVGGFIDKSCLKPLTLAKAKEQKLRMAKLPLDRYLKWAKGSKYLTVNQMIEIMSVWKMTNSWEEALKIVPTRKLVTS